MSILSDLYISSPQTAARYDKDQDLPASDRVELGGLTYAEFADLYAALEGKKPAARHSKAFEEVLNIDGGERLIHRFPPALVKLLAALDKQGIAAAASKWVQFGELAHLECEAKDVIPLITDASRLARLAQSTSKSLYLWMSV